MKILIAEDDQTQQKLIKMLMNYWDFAFDIAPDGRQAIELAKTNEGEYDLCLMDIDMPIMNGFEAVKIIRHEMKYLPIMALTGNSMAADKYVEAGMDDFLQKPYDPNKLYDKISELTVKVSAIQKKQNQIVLRKELPVNSEDLRELIELKKKGLAKLKLVGLGYTFIVHRNIQNKIAYDLIGEGKELSEFIDRSEKEPGRCHLYKMNLHVTKDLLIPDELEDAIQKEDQIAMRFDKVTDKKLPE
ncbi:MAG: response regulator [Nitrospirae bacterium]|nr:response regulator [Nitrospirota bacterium]